MRCRTWRRSRARSSRRWRSCSSSHTAPARTRLRWRRSRSALVGLEPVVERLQADPEHVGGALLLAEVVERGEREDPLDLLVRHAHANPEVLAAVRGARGKPG